MSMFDNIVFDEFTLLEGEQTEAYKKRKGEEKDKDLEHSYNRAMRYNTAGMEQYKGDNRKAYKDAKSATKAIKSSPEGDKSYRQAKHDAKEAKKNPNYYSDPDKAKASLKNLAKTSYAVDAYDRHQRRHPKHECTFSTNYLYESSEIDII